MKQSKELTKELEDSKNEYQRKVKQLFNESEDDLNNRTDINTENEQNELIFRSYCINTMASFIIK